MGKAEDPGSAREAELARMMEQYGAALVGICAMLLGDYDLAQDAVQETFIKAYRAMDDLRREHAGSEKAWLTRIAVNVCRDQQRTKWFRFVDRGKDIDALVLPAPDAGEQARELYSAVQSLPRRHREIILLHYYQDMQAQEMAEALGISRQTVYRRLEAARRILKRILERWDFCG